MPDIKFEPEHNVVGIFHTEKPLAFVVDANHVETDTLFVAVPHADKSVVISEHEGKLKVAVFNLPDTTCDGEIEVELAND
jgi:alpha-L-arabinofuranosidase